MGQAVGPNPLICGEQFSPGSAFGDDVGDPTDEAGSPVIQFHEDHFTYDEHRRGFFVDEPDTLLGDLIT